MLSSLKKFIIISLTLSNLIFLAKPSNATLYEGEACKMLNGDSGVCVLLTDCKSINNGLRQRKISFENLFRCSFSGRREIVCCPDPEHRATGSSTESSLIFDSSRRTSSSRPSTSTSQSIDGTGVKVDTDRPAVVACRRIQEDLSPELTQHILDGIPAEIGEFPHMAAIGFPQISNEFNYTFDCGGTLISDKFVLTVAHCLLDGRRRATLVRLGKIVIHSTRADDNVGTVDVGIQEIIAHPDYNGRETYHDIALIELDRRVTFTQYVRPTCLYTDLADPPLTAKLYVTGWGTINKNTRSVSGILLKAPLQIAPVDKCNASHVDNGLTRRNSRGVIAEQICAYDPEIRKDACQGDSGGPLQMVVDESLYSYTVVGLISSGFGCGTAIPGLYTRVASYLDFIEQNVWPTGI